MSTLQKKLFDKAISQSHYRGHRNKTLLPATDTHCLGPRKQNEISFISELFAAQSLSRVQLFVTPRTAAHHASLSMEFSRQDYWCGLPLPSQGIFLTQGSNPGLLHWQADSLPLNHQRSPQSPQSNMTSENNSPPTQILSANGKESVCTQPSNKASNLSKTKNAKKYIF